MATPDNYGKAISYHLEHKEKARFIQWRLTRRHPKLACADFFQVRPARLEKEASRMDRRQEQVQEQ